MSVSLFSWSCASETGRQRLAVGEKKGKSSPTAGLRSGALLVRVRPPHPPALDGKWCNEGPGNASEKGREKTMCVCENGPPKKRRVLSAPSHLLHGSPHAKALVASHQPASPEGTERRGCVGKNERREGRYAWPVRALGEASGSAA